MRHAHAGRRWIPVFMALVAMGAPGILVAETAEPEHTQPRPQMQGREFDRDVAQFLERYRRFLGCCAANLDSLPEVKTLEAQASALLAQARTGLGTLNHTGLSLEALARRHVSVRAVVVTPDAEQKLLTAFLESIYLEWADRPSPSLNGQTPRHAMHAADSRAKVAALIEALERNDLATRRTGKTGYDYNRLRAHVGL